MGGGLGWGVGVWGGCLFGGYGDVVHSYLYTVPFPHTVVNCEGRLLFVPYLPSSACGCHCGLSFCHVVLVSRVTLFYHV